MGFREYWAGQFAYPCGFCGKIATIIMNCINEAMYKAAVANIPKDGKILDIGFGNGVVLKRALKRSDGKFYGVDISRDMIKAAAKRNKKAIREGRLTLAEGSVDAIPFDEEFDLIYTTNTVYFWKDLDAALLEIKKKLADGGVFLNILYTKEWLDKVKYADYGFSKYTANELIKAAEDKGFETSVETIKEGKSYMVKALKPRQ